MKILIIDNYDSFTFNLYQYVGELLQAENIEFILDVFRNDDITVKKIVEEKYDRIIISPGPGDPADKKYFGVCSEVILTLGKKTPILGVCLGMQGIAYYFCGKIVRAKTPMHGKTSLISHDGKGVFLSLSQNLAVMRYHSLIVEKSSLPDCFEISAVVSRHSESSLGSINIDSRLRGNDEVEIMGIRHKEYPIEGIQFHPESFATEGGKDMLRNFLFQRHDIPF